MHAEIRGRGRTWRVWTPDASGLPHPVPLYDQDGIFKEWLIVGAPTGKLKECYGGPFSSIEEATEYATYLGYAEVKVIRTKTKREALAVARAARQKGDTDDD